MIYFAFLFSKYFNRVDGQPCSNNNVVFLVHREMIEHCFNCYGKRYTENGKEEKLR